MARHRKYTPRIGIDVPRRLALALFVLLLAVGLAVPSWSQPPPRLEKAGDGVVLTILPPVLGEPEVREHLGTGLTTTFVFRVDGRDGGGSKVRGAARIEVRYELWDEIYQLAALGLDGRLQRFDAHSFEDLLDRWRNLRLPVLTGVELGSKSGGPPRLDVRLEIIPFSRGEQRDTQRWFAESIDRSGAGNAEKAGRVSEDRPEALGEVLHLLMATSIQRRALLDFSWEVPVLAGEVPRAGNPEP